MMDRFDQFNAEVERKFSVLLKSANCIVDLVPEVQPRPVRCKSGPAGFGNRIVGRRFMITRVFAQRVFPDPRADRESENLRLVGCCCFGVEVLPPILEDTPVPASPFIPFQGHKGGFLSQISVLFGVASAQPRWGRVRFQEGVLGLGGWCHPLPLYRRGVRTSPPPAICIFDNFL